MSGTTPASASPRRPRAAGWLTGAVVLALGVQAIFLLVPEPKSAGATDPAGPEIATDLDSTAFTLEEDATALPLDTASAAADITRAALTADTAAVQSIPAPVEGLPAAATPADSAAPPPPAADSVAP